jgi:hypothetical protein
MVELRDSGPEGDTPPYRRYRVWENVVEPSTIVGLSPAQYDVALVANPALPPQLLDEVLAQFGLGLVQSKAAITGAQ